MEKKKDIRSFLLYWPCLHNLTLVSLIQVLNQYLERPALLQPGGTTPSFQHLRSFFSSNFLAWKHPSEPSECTNPSKHTRLGIQLPPHLLKDISISKNERSCHSGITISSLLGGSFIDFAITISRSAAASMSIKTPFPAVFHCQGLEVSQVQVQLFTQFSLYSGIQMPVSGARYYGGFEIIQVDIHSSLGLHVQVSANGMPTLLLNQKSSISTVSRLWAFLLALAQH